MDISFLFSDSWFAIDVQIDALLTPEPIVPISTPRQININPSSRMLLNLEDAERQFVSDFSNAEGPSEPGALQNELTPGARLCQEIPLS